MPSFEEHLAQFETNLNFLSGINQKFEEDYWDWKVTVTFYSALHLINAHIVKIAGLHYRNHDEVRNAISPFNQLSPCKVSEEIFTSYRSLESLSRISRYLCNPKKSSSNSASFTYGKHFAKSIRQLDKIIAYMDEKYEDLEVGSIHISCVDLKNFNHIKYFKKAL